MASPGTITSKSRAYASRIVESTQKLASDKAVGAMFFKTIAVRPIDGLSLADSLRIPGRAGAQKTAAGAASRGAGNGPPGARPGAGGAHAAAHSRPPGARRRPQSF